MSMPTIKCPEFNWSKSDRVSEWRRFRTMTEIILEGPYKDLSEEAKVGCVVNWMGIQGAELRSTWTMDDDERKGVKFHLDKYEQYMKPQSNFRLARFKFRQKLQRSDQTIESFVADLRIAIKECRYQSEDEHIIDGVIFGTKEKRIREKLLENDDPNLTIKEALDQIKPIEASRIQASGIEGATFSSHDTKVHSVKRRDYSRDRTSSNKNCTACGKSHPPKRCPAFNTKCSKCGHLNHWAAMCKTKKKSQQHGNRQRRRSRQRDQKSSSQHRIHGVEEQRQSVRYESDSDSNESLNTKFQTMYYHSVENHKNKNSDSRNKLYVKVPVSTKQARTSVSFKIDTGAEGNLLPVADYVRLFPKCKLDEFGMPVSLKHNNHVKLIAFNGTEIKQHGTCSVTLLYKGKCMKSDFFVVTHGPAILGLPMTEKLGIISINVDTVKQLIDDKEVKRDSTDYYNTDKDKHDSCVAKDAILREYADVFNGVGCFDGECTIHLDHTIPPSVRPPRRVPVALQEPLKAELESMEAQGIIASLAVDEPSEWCNSFVCATKSNGSLRFCLDPARLNEAIIRPYHYTPTLEDVLPKLNGAKYFSILDARSGYWNINLDRKSSYYTTFATPYGRYRFLRLPFGLSCSSDMFQKKIDETYGNMPQVTGIADDLVIIGYDEDGSDHDRNLKAFLERTREKGIKLNPDKCIIKCTRIPFYGMITGSNGLEPDPNKVQAIVEMNPPTNVKDLQSFLGVVNYLSGFSPYVAELATPLRQLLRKDSVFIWTPEYNRAFNAIKKEMASPKVLKFFDHDKPVILEVDASGHGLGAALLQPANDSRNSNLQPVVYASKTLSDTEKRYANIEREMLAIVFAVERFHHYTYGRKIQVITDHKPLVAILKKGISSAPPRLARMLLRLQKYDIELEYTPGKQLKLADALSRIDPCPGKEIEGLDMTVHEFETQVNASPQKLDDIRRETELDSELQCLKHTIMNGWPEFRSECPPHICNYWNYRDELSLIDGILLKGNRIIIPKMLRCDVLNQIHYAHLGIDKCRLRARDSVFWPNINKDIADLISQCEACCELQNNNKKEPLIAFDIPPTPWHTLASDLFFYDNENYLIVVDYYSKFPVVRKIPNITTEQVIKNMKLIFEDQGVPVKLVSDSGSQYLSAQFQQFSKLYNFEHVAVSPLHHQANGMVERCIQTVKRIIKKCKKSNQDLNFALLCYKTTPIDHKLPAPCVLLNNRVYKSNLPTIPLSQLMHKSSTYRMQRDMVHDQLQHRQDKQKTYYDKHTQSLDRLYEGQYVVIQDDRGLWTKTGHIDKVDHDRRQYVVITDNGSSYVRNRKYIKPFQKKKDGSKVIAKDNSKVHDDYDLSIVYGLNPDLNVRKDNKVCNTHKKKVTFQLPEEPSVRNTDESVSNKIIEKDSSNMKTSVDKPLMNTQENKYIRKSGRKIKQPDKLNL